MRIKVIFQIKKNYPAGNEDEIKTKVYDFVGMRDQFNFFLTETSRHEYPGSIKVYKRSRVDQDQ